MSSQKPTSTTKFQKAKTSSGSAAWQRLHSGDKIRVQSHSGNSYDATIVLAGRDESGLFIRLEDGKLARLMPSRVNWKTLEKLGAADPVTSGDEVIVVALGTERRGTLVGSIEDRISLTLPKGKVYSVPMEDTEVKKFRLVFPTKTVKPGDEFMVKSLSGKEYRGIVIETSEQHIQASLRPSRERMKLLLSRLDLTTMNVLIPVLGVSQTWQ